MRATNPLPPITTKADLERYLTEAATLEHQFMAQYLYAAFSLKKDPDERCGDAEFEYVRRWASTIYRIARQEMEHLSIVNSILTAIGGQPYFGHVGSFPTLTRWYLQDALRAKRSGPVLAAAMGAQAVAAMPPPCDIPFFLERFSLATARRYACMESPHLSCVVPADREDLLRWCYQDAAGGCPSIAPMVGPAHAHGVNAAGAISVPLAPSLVGPVPVRAPGLVGAPPDDVQIGTIQDLYDAIDDGLRRLDAQLGSAELFNGHCSGSRRSRASTTSTCSRSAISRRRWREPGS